MDISISNARSETYGTLGFPAGPTDWSSMTGMGVPQTGGFSGNSVSTAPFYREVENDEGQYIESTFLAPSVGIDYVKHMREGMMMFAIRHHLADPGATVVVNQAQLNRLMREQWDEFVRRTTESANRDGEHPEDNQFLDLLRQHGELGLELYDMYVNSTLESNRKRAAAYSAFATMAVSEKFCYLTSYGIRKRVNYIGPILSLSISSTLDEGDYANRTDPSSLAVGVAKNVPCAAIFGPSNEMHARTKLWMIITRVRCEGNKCGTFCVKATYSKTTEDPEMPSHMALTYRDESGALCNAIRRYVGSVLVPPTEYSPSAAIQLSTGCGPLPPITPDGEMRNHYAIPMMVIAAGLA